MINTFETSFEARERRFQIEKLYHGETVDLIGVVTTDGVPKNITGYSVSGVFQPTSMNGSDDFYSLSADIVENKVVVHWEKGKDFGEPSYMVWALLTDGDDASYPIAWRLDMAYSPSFPLSDLAPIPKAIDFSKYELLNAPWAMLSDFQNLQEDVSELSDGLSAYATKEEVTEEIAEGIAALSDEYETKEEVQEKLNGKVSLSGDTMTGALTVPSFTVGSRTAGSTIGFNSVSEGAYNTASGTYSHAEGVRSTASGIASHAEGSSKAYATNSHAEGDACETHGNNSHAEGSYSKTGSSAAAAHAEGTSTVANGQSSHSEGVGTIANNEGEHAGGKYNASHSFDNYAGKTLFSRGFGDTAQARKNAVETMNDGKTFVYGVGGYDGTNPTGAQNAATDIATVINGKADKSEIPEVPTDLSAFTNSPGYLTAHQDLTDYATKTYVQEYVDEHGGPTNLSDYVPISAFNAIFKLEQDATSADMLSTINAIIVAVKGTSYDSRKTYVVYTDNSTAELDLTGNVLTSSIPNISNVKAISFGTDVTSLANGLFQNKTNLQEVTIPGTVGTVSNRAFSYGYPTYVDRAVSSVTLNEGTTILDTDCFYGTTFSSITIPSTVTTMVGNTFGYNYHLLSFYVPATLTSMPMNNGGGFSGCKNLSSIIVDSENPNYKSVDEMLLTKDGTTLLKIPQAKNGSITVPEGVTSINGGGAAALTNCTSLTLPSTLISIGNSALDAFDGQPGWASITIPSSVTSIGQYGFSIVTGKTIVMEGKTMAQVQGMQYYPWDVKSRSGTQFVCTDGTITR